VSPSAFLRLVTSCRIFETFWTFLASIVISFKRWNTWGRKNDLWSESEGNEYTVSSIQLAWFLVYLSVHCQSFFEPGTSRPTEPTTEESPSEFDFLQNVMERTTFQQWHSDLLTQQWAVMGYPILCRQNYSNVWVHSVFYILKQPGSDITVFPWFWNSSLI
jgi:hypothetical protein